MRPSIESAGLPMALGGSLAFGLAMLSVEWGRGPLWDERIHLAAAQGIQQGGLFGHWFGSEMRTYLYPYLLSLVLRMRDNPDRAAVAVAQWLVWAGSSLCMGRTMSRLWPRARTTVWFTTLCNPFVLIYTVEYLTDALSTALVFLSLSCAVAVASGDRRTLWDGLLGLAVGSAIMIRPSNLALVPMALGACWMARTWGQKARTAARALLAGAIVVTPQVVLNWTNYRVFQPLVVAPLGDRQLSWGRVALKYATVAIRSRPAQVWYPNPHAEAWVAGTGFFDKLCATALTLPLKAVGLLDQDLVFPYGTTTHPVYRWPVAAIHFSLLAFGVLGLVALSRENALCRRLVALTVLFVASSLALYSLTVVEARFGLPLIAVVYVFSPAGALLAAESVRNGPLRQALGILVLWLLTVVVLFAGARTLTDLMDRAEASSSPVSRKVYRRIPWAGPPRP